ncbi:MAG: endo-1,4-beta-xylanase, partial [Treponema sp.]|nr:endo-1,4-beta-xylanase [Treponema sp.]
MKMMKRFALIVGIALLAFASCGTGAEHDPGLDTLPSLRMIWADYFPMGNIISSVDYSWRPARVADIGNPTREELLIRHFDFLTAEDEMKPSWLRPNPHAFNVGGANRIMDFARTHGMRVHGHVLAWHSQSPWWMNLSASTPSGWTYTSA